MVNFSTKDFKKKFGYDTVTLGFYNNIQVMIIDTKRMYLVKSTHRAFPQRVCNTLLEVDSHLSRIRNFRGDMV